jgi:hypothetical protein
MPVVSMVIKELDKFEVISRASSSESRGILDASTASSVDIFLNLDCYGMHFHVMLYVAHWTDRLCVGVDRDLLARLTITLDSFPR